MPVSTRGPACQTVRQTQGQGGFGRAIAIASILLAAQGWALAGPDRPADGNVGLSAIVSYETRMVLASGITRTDTWKERLVRRDGNVWIERIVTAPEGHEHGHDHAAEKTPEHMGHKHFNGDTSARWLRRTDPGDKSGRSVRVWLVDREHKAVVSIPPAEFSTVGVDGNFDAAGSIVPASVVQAMKPGQGPGGSADLRWKAESNNGWSHHVLWSDSKQLAMKVVSEKTDGSVRRVVSVALQPSPATPPWETLAGYEQKTYSDFGD